MVGRFLVFFALVSVCLLSCKPAPQPIQYGEDICIFCKMTIVDAQHGAEAITDKGKVYKFDAIECLVDYLNDKTTISEHSFLLVNDFNNPSALISAEESTYLISKDLPSPMGAFLTAFKDKQNAIQMQKMKGGTLYNWQELLPYLHENRLSPTGE